MKASRICSLSLGAYLLSVSSCRTASTDQRTHGIMGGDGNAKNTGVVTAIAGNNIVNATPPPSTSLTADSINPANPAPQPRTSKSAAPAAVLASSDQVQQLRCYRVADATKLDVFDEAFSIVGSTKNGSLGIDISESAKSTHYDLASTGISDSTVKFQGSNNNAAVTLQVATTTQNLHALYAGTAIINNQTDNTTTNLNLSCDVNGQFRVDTSDRVKGYQASN